LEPGYVRKKTIPAVLKRELTQEEIKEIKEESVTEVRLQGQSAIVTSYPSREQPDSTLVHQGTISSRLIYEEPSQDVEAS
jgi:collagenase-like PrtC family protease